MVGLKQSVFAENIIYVNETTFPDKALREEVLKQWDKVKPDDFDDDEEDTDDDYYYDNNENCNSKVEEGVQIDADLIRYFSVDSHENKSKITNLKGIELLTKLESLTIHDYIGGKIDLSKNTELDRVCIYSKKYALSPNDFAFLKKLTDLAIGGKVVSNFDCSKLKNLTDLSINSTSGIKRLDISKCHKFRFLQVNTDSLASVNLGKSSKFECIYIENAKKLSSINVSKLTNLRFLSVRNCDINKIDVSKNKKLEQLWLNGNKKIKSLNVKNNTCLDFIHIGYTAISKLDTSKLKKLNRLEVYNTKISSLNLKRNTKLSYLDVSNTPLKTLDIKNNKKIRNIKIVGSKIKSLNLKNQKALYDVICSYGQKIAYPSKVIENSCWISIEGVKKGSSITVPSICKGYKFSADKEYSLKYKNNKIITSKKTKKKYAYGDFTKGNKQVSIIIKYK